MDPAWQTQALRILVVEDNAGDQELLRVAVERNRVSAELRSCLTRRDTLDALVLGPLPDLILLDLQLPDGHGLDLLREIKENESWARIPVIILSSSAEPHEVEAGYAAQASAYLQKPTSQDGWQKLVRSFTDYWLKVVLLPKP